VQLFHHHMGGGVTVHDASSSILGALARGNCCSRWA
jgi:hypothetical protein